MSILLDQNTRLIVQGITGREGTFHTEQMLAYGTRVVAGVTPGKRGESVLGVPVFGTVREAMEETGANASVVFVPARYTRASVCEALDAGVKLVMTIAEHVPVHDMLLCYHLARMKRARLTGPNSFGVISPGKAKAGFMAHSIFRPGSVGLMTRSATNGYESAFLMDARGIGISTAVGVGGDMIPGSTFVDLLPDFEEDPETKAIAIIGEIGGVEEELAADYIRAYGSKSVVAIIAGKRAPKGRSMGHAGAIVAADGTGSAESKERALRAAGVHIAENPEHLASILEALSVR